MLSTTGKKSKHVYKLEFLFPVLFWQFLLCISHCGNVLMREKQLSETCWGVKIYFPHFLRVKTLFLICSNPAVAFTQQGDSVAFKATLRHTSCTLGCLPPNLYSWLHPSMEQSLVGALQVSMVWQKCASCFSLQMDDCKNLKACLSMHFECL